MVSTPSMTTVNWRALALKRLSYLVELRRTGRWQLHFSCESAFEDALGKAAADADRWKQLAYKAQEPEAAE